MQILRLAYNVLVTPKLTAKINFLKSNGIKNPSLAFFSDQKDTPWLSQGSLKADFPLTFLPSNVVQCGPIYLSSAPASEQDPEIANWLKRAPTIFINLGSHTAYTEPAASEIILALKEAINTYNVQVLWKFNKQSNYSDDFLLPVKDEIADGRIKMEKWIQADPAALLETGNVILFVHHGGSSGYHEAVA